MTTMDSPSVQVSKRAHLDNLLIPSAQNSYGTSSTPTSFPPTPSPLSSACPSLLWSRSSATSPDSYLGDRDQTLPTPVSPSPRRGFSTADPILMMTEGFILETPRKDEPAAPTEFVMEYQVSPTLLDTPFSDTSAAAALPGQLSHFAANLSSCNPRHTWSTGVPPGMLNVFRADPFAQSAPDAPLHRPSKLPSITPPESADVDNHDFNFGLAKRPHTPTGNEASPDVSTATGSPSKVSGAKAKKRRLNSPDTNTTFPFLATGPQEMFAHEFRLPVGPDALHASGRADDDHIEAPSTSKQEPSDSGGYMEVDGDNSVQPPTSQPVRSGLQCHPDAAMYAFNSYPMARAVPSVHYAHNGAPAVHALYSEPEPAGYMWSLPSSGMQNQVYGSIQQQDYAGAHRMQIPHMVSASWIQADTRPKAPSFEFTLPPPPVPRPDMRASGPAASYSPITPTPPMRTTRSTSHTQYVNTRPSEPTENPAATYSCSLCPRAFTTPNGLSQHTKWHQRRAYLDDIVMSSSNRTGPSAPACEQEKQLQHGVHGDVDPGFGRADDKVVVPVSHLRRGSISLEAGNHGNLVGHSQSSGYVAPRGGVVCADLRARRSQRYLCAHGGADAVGAEEDVARCGGAGGGCEVIGAEGVGRGGVEAYVWTCGAPAGHVRRRWWSGFRRGERCVLDCLCA
ncbi:hypothetical protein EVG20_g7354 [Dentipellis fragilis]|uniref:C2H2-type domain-containing protein n=1 Tax=Dentipellis fragilis TaxID=205917 RepID=A0A4Y9YE63_9AGAM|nr:hypothetical protein EVG20_g7354 [Dentipellis fragilis]